MDFALRIQEAVTRGRIFAESLMLDSVVVWRDGEGEPTVDEWGVITPPPPVVVYEGAAKSQNDRTYPSAPTVADSSTVTEMVSHVHFPHGTSDVRSGDVVEWVSSLNPRLVGRKVRVEVDMDKTWNTALRMNVVEVVA